MAAPEYHNHHLDSHIVVEIPMDEPKAITTTTTTTTTTTEMEDPIAAIQHHPLMEISQSPGHLLLLKLWQREEDLIATRMADKETRMDSYRAQIFQLCCLLFLFNGLFLTLLFSDPFSAAAAAKDQKRRCNKWWIPSFLSLTTCLVVVFLVQVQVFRHRKVSRQLRRERDDSRALARCVQELRMKGASFDLDKEPQIGKKMKSSSVEVKWKPVAWFRENLEILRVTTLLGNAQILEQTGLELAIGRPLASGGMYSNGRADVNGWASPYRSEMSGLSHQSSPQSWLGSHGNSSVLVVKKTMRVDVPVDKYPNYNFVGRLLGPRGNSLKRVEASTESRVLIRGRGSIKDPAKEEMMRGKPGYEHLNEPLHILVEAELPVEIIDARLFQARSILEDLLKPVDESQDFFKKQQLRELAMLNGTLRDEGAHMSGSVSPFNNGLGMKRAKTQG